MAEQNNETEGGLLQRIKDIAGSISGWLKEKAVYYYEECKKVATGVVSGVMTKAQEFVEWVKVVSGKVETNLTEYQLDVAGWINRTVWTAIEYTVTQCDSFGLRVREMLTDIIDWSLAKGKGLYVRIKEIILEIGGDIAAKTKKFAETLDSLSDIIKRKVKEGIANVQEALDYPERILAAVADISEERWTEVGDFFGRLLGRILLYVTRDIELKE